MKRAIATLVLLSACASPVPATEVMLEIDAEPAVRERSAQQNVRVLGGEAGRPEAYAPRYERTSDAAWPRRIALVPLGAGTARGWLADIEALGAAGERVAASTVAGGYDEQRTVLVRVVLEDACIGVACEGMRCEGGRCLDSTVDVAAAPDLEPE